MAEFGAKYPCFKSNASGVTAGVVLGKLVAANLTVNLSSGELYADDALAEQLSQFASGSIAMETDNMDDDVASAIYGATVTDGVVIYKSTDTAPEGTLAYYKTLMVGGVKKWRGYVYPRVKAAIGNDNAQTRGSSITFQTAQTTFTVLEDSTSVWRRTKDCDTEADAISFVKTACGIT